MVRAVRGAITVKNNDASEILDATGELLKKMIEENGLIHEDMISMTFSLTPDLNACFPAKKAREMGYGDVPLICMAEIPVRGALEMCIRALIYFNTDKKLCDIKHIYMKDAAGLRPDLIKKENERKKDMKRINVAVDGPAGAGKSSVSKAVAKKLGLVYVDTGAMYRACALYAIKNGIEISEKAIKPHLDKITIDIDYDDNGQKVFLNGEEVTDLIRSPKVSQGASDIAVIPAVRIKLVEIQRNIANNKSIIMDGRDIGTYVLPDADLKIYLTASVEERARRRYLENKEKGIECDIEKVKEEIIKRDKTDSEREFAPLRRADDAVEVDTSDMGFDEVCEHIYNMIKAIMER